MVKKKATLKEINFTQKYDIKKNGRSEILIAEKPTKERKTKRYSSKITK